MSPADRADCVVVGAGVIGLATARALALRGLGVVVVEAARAIGTGASSRSSEVIHAGIYYPPDSWKARLCVRGRDLLYAYCAARGVPHRRIGKLVLAVREREVATLETYLAQGRASGVADLRWVESDELAVLEPAVRAVRALHSPSTGILDTHAFMLALQADLEAAGGQVVLGHLVEQVTRAGRDFELQVRGLPGPAIRCARLVNAAGIGAARLAASFGAQRSGPPPRTYLARGHYFALSGPAPFRQLVYPVAETAGLGIHVTLDLAGRARFGPDAAWIDNEDYRFDETRLPAFVTAIRRYFPGLDETRLRPAYTGIRTKLSGPGEAARDFLIETPREHGIAGLVNLLGVESPGLTASLALADIVAETLD